jgi:hypothetical protein
MIDKEELIKKYKEKLAKDLKSNSSGENLDFEPSAYFQFKKELMPKELSIYEKLCNSAENILKVSSSPSSRDKLQKAIDSTHLEVTPEGTQSFAIIFPFLFILLGGIVSYFVPLIFGKDPLIFFVFFFLIVGLALMLIFRGLPFQFEKRWRLAASNQMIMSIFYLVTYLRHTSNLENAIAFASEHLSGPLALDFKRILWQVENQKYESLSEALDMYLLEWQDSNSEFVEAINLIESSLLETSDDRRLNVLDKSLEVILDRTEEKMLHYAQNLTGPINMLHMLGIIMPILGLVIMPLVVSIMSDGIAWYHISALYNVLLPIMVYYFGKNILASRPTGYGDTDITDINPELKKKKKVKIGNFYLNPVIPAIIIFVVFFVLGTLPLLMGSLMNVPDDADKYPDLCFTKSLKPFNPLKSPKFKPLFCTLEYRKQGAKFVGPFGLISTIASIFVVIGLGVSIGYFYRKRSGNVMSIRANSKKLEAEFSSALFHLGNRMSDGIPAEIAFGKVSTMLGNSPSGDFFSRVYYNINRLGKNLEDAIFDEKIGAIKSVPSNVIISSMKVLIESARKGPRVAAQAMMNVAEYIKQIHHVNERIKDLMAETISSMNAQVKGLAPGIAAVIVSITSMITFILGRLNVAEETAQGLQSAGGIGAIFSGGGIPTYHFQLIVGVYVVQIIFILTQLSNTIENGTDKLNEEFMEGQNMVRGTLIYSLIAMVVMIIFNTLAGVILGQV